MTYVVFLGPVAIGAILLLIYCFMTMAYEGAVAIGTVLENSLPIIGAVLLAILLVISIIGAVKKRSFLYGLVMVLSWSKTILFNLISMYVIITVAQAAGSVWLALFVVPISFAVICIPVMLETSSTIKAWTAASEERSLRPAVIQMIVAWIAVAVLCVIGALL